jgi:TolB protein
MPRLTRGLALLAGLAAATVAVVMLVAAASARPPAKHSQIAFRRFFDKQNSTGAIFVINPDGSGSHQVTHPAPGGLDDQPDWAPDGSRILFTRQPAGDNPDTQRAFWTVKPDGSDPQLLSPPCTAGPPQCAPKEQKSGPLYSPDGTKIAYGFAAGSVRDDIGQIQFSEVYVMNADGSLPHPVTTFTKHAPYTEDVGPAAWSPDSSHLVISRAMSLAGKPRGGRALFVINADGTGLRQLTPWDLGASGRADWSRDGRRIVFHTLPPTEGPGGDIYTIHPDGSGLRQLTHFHSKWVLGELAYSPDAKRIVFTKGADSRDVFVMRADGTHVRQITRTELSENWPSWGRPASP